MDNMQWPSNSRQGWRKAATEDNQRYLPHFKMCSPDFFAMYNAQLYVYT